MVTMQIWTNRLLKELDGIDSRLPAGLSLSSHDMEPEAGVCKAYFEAALSAPASTSGGDDGPAREGDSGGNSVGVDDSTAPPPPLPPSDAVEKEHKIDGDAPPQPPSKDDEEEDKGKGDETSAEAGEEGNQEEEGVSEPSSGELKAAAAAASCGLLTFKIEMDLGLDTRYPFECPVIRVLEGDDVIPSSILSGDDLLSLPGSDSWTPSSTIVDTLQDIADMVLHAREAGLPTGRGGGDKGALERGELRPGSVVGTEALLFFPCTPPVAPLFSGSVLAPRSRRPLDRYVGLTDRQLLELEAHRTLMNKTVVVSSIPLSGLKKLKFRRGASMTVVLKNGEVKEFLTAQSFDCVTAVTQRLEKMGIAGHQTTAGAERQVDHARSLMATLKRKEEMFGVQERPDLTLVEECMDMFRQAAELYSAAGDPRHEEVVAQMHRFLQRPDVVDALGGGVGSSASDGVDGADAAATGSNPRGTEAGARGPAGGDDVLVSDVSHDPLGVSSQDETDGKGGEASAAETGTAVPDSPEDGVEAEEEEVDVTNVGGSTISAAASSVSQSQKVPPSVTGAPITTPKKGAATSSSSGGDGTRGTKTPSTVGRGGRGGSRAAGRTAGAAGGRGSPSGRAPGGRVTPSSAGKKEAVSAGGGASARASPRAAEGIGRGRGKTRGGRSGTTRGGATSRGGGRGGAKPAAAGAGTGAP